MQSDFLSFIVTSEESGLRLDRYIMHKIDSPDIAVSRTAVQNLINADRVIVNGKSRNKSYKVKTGDIISAELPEPEEYRVEAENIPLDIIYEDRHLLVVNKPKGMVVHPANGHRTGTLVNGILYHCGDELTGIGGVMRPGIVHRIDKDTSGLLVVAKTGEAYASLAGQLYNHSMTREYHAVCHGTFSNESGRIDAPITRDAANRKRFAVGEGGKPSVTDYSLIGNGIGYSYLSLRLHTGRTHQIRVHMSYIGHPVAGDTLYGPRNTPKELGGQCLHAKTLGFVHPFIKERMEFDSELPQYFTGFLKTIHIEDA